MSVDVVVVGGGLSGLVAAHRLSRAGVAVRVLEAAGRVGGRIRDFTSKSGERFALGGEWFGRGEARFGALLGELGLRSRPVHNPGAAVVRLGGRTRAGGAGETWFSPVSVPDAVVGSSLRSAFDELTRLRPTPAMDDSTLATWRDARLDDAEQRTLFDIVVRQETGREPGETSVFHYATLHRTTLRFLEDDHVVEGGTERVIESLANGLDIRTGALVERVEQAAGRVRVTTATGVHRGRQVIVAVPPPVARRIAFAPELPPARRRLHDEMDMGRIIKCVVIYSRPFWHDLGLSGALLSDEGPLECTVGAGVQTRCGALIGYITGDAARRWSARGADARRAAVLAQLAEVFGPPAGRPLEYVDADWSTTPFVGGAYSASPAPGVLSRCADALRAPWGRVHWASTETAARWTGTLEGAILAGERAAAEVITARG